MTVAAADAQNQPLDPAPPWSFRTDPYPELAKLFPNDALPAVTDSGDTDAVTLGVKFSPATAGSVVGIRYYKAAANTGTHTGGLWTVHGVRLGEVTFADEESVGWQTATFATPIAVQPGTTYVVSYHAPHGALRGRHPLLRQRLDPGSTERPGRRQRPLPVRPGRLPGQHLRRRQLLGRRAAAPIRLTRAPPESGFGPRRDPDGGCAGVAPDGS